MFGLAVVTVTRALHIITLRQDYSLFHPLIARKWFGPVNRGVIVLQPIPATVVLVVPPVTTAPPGAGVTTGLTMHLVVPIAVEVIPATAATITSISTAAAVPAWGITAVTESHKHHNQLVLCSTTNHMPR